MNPILRNTLNKSIDVYTLYAVFFIASVLIGRVSWLLSLATIGVTIPIYSFLWCVAQDLTDEDWDSVIATQTSVIMVWLVIFADMVSLVFLVVAIPFVKESTINIVAALIIILTIVFIVGIRIHNTKHMLFLGAYMNYRKRIRGEMK